MARSTWMGWAIGRATGRAIALVAAGLAALALASCADYGGSLPKHLRPLDSGLRSLIASKGMDERSPILIRIYKEEATLEVWKQQRATGRYALLKTYEICAWSGVLGPKIKEGDRQAPEGFYTIRPAQMNPNSNYYLAFNMGYPNEFDRSLGRTGSELMVHGACSSRGCYSMTDESIQEIYTLGRLAFQAGQREFQVQAFPFRMTAENMAKHRNDPNIGFWMMLKEGSDHFEILGQPPKIDVCDHRYIFDSVPAGGRSFNASASCPPMSMPETVRVAVAQKEAKDNVKMLALAKRLDRKERSDGLEALTVALATPTSAARAAPMSVPASVLEEPGPSMTASVPPPESAVPAESAPAAVAATEAAPVPEPRPRPAAVATATPAPAKPKAPAAAPAVQQAAAEAGDVSPRAPAGETFLPSPELRKTESASAEPAPAAPPKKKPQAAPTQGDAATLEERMLAGSQQADPGVASAYASASQEDQGLTGFVLRLFKDDK